MTDGIKVSIPALRKFKNGLESLPSKVARQILSSAMRKSSKILEKAIEMRTPIGKSAIGLKSIKIKARKISDYERLFVIGSMSQKGENPWYLRLLETGFKWKIFAKGKGSRQVGKKKAVVIRSGTYTPKPFMRPAFDSVENEMRETMVNEVSKAVEKQFKKLSQGKNG